MLFEIRLVLTWRKPVKFWKKWRCGKYVVGRVNLEQFSRSIVVILISFINILNGKLFQSTVIFSDKFFAYTL